jgi:hypothetical protein
LHTPILTSRNMIVVLPALYLIAAQMTTSVARRWGKVAGASYLAVQIGLMGQPVAAYYTSVINEQWRDSSALVIRTPGCQSGTIHVYGDLSLYRFFTKWVRPDLDLIDIPEGAAADLSNLPLSTCQKLEHFCVVVSPKPTVTLDRQCGLSNSKEAFPASEIGRPVHVTHEKFRRREGIYRYQCRIAAQAKSEIRCVLRRIGIDNPNLVAEIAPASA